MDTLVRDVHVAEETPKKAPPAGRKVLPIPRRASAQVAVATSVPSATKTPAKAAGSKAPPPKTNAAKTAGKGAVGKVPAKAVVRKATPRGKAKLPECVHLTLEHLSVLLI